MEILNVVIQICFPCSQIMSSTNWGRKGYQCTYADSHDWKMVFIKNRHWEGTYVYKNVSHWCALLVHSVQLDINGVMYGTFSDGNSSIEFNGKSFDNITVILEKFTTNNEHFSAIFPRNQAIEIQGRLSGSNDDWAYSGKFIKPLKDFGTLHLWSHEQRHKHFKSDIMKVALPVGLSVSLAVFGLTVMIVMLIWAKRKGYLRHVPFSYKHFDNRARDGAVNFNGQSDAVHM